jgi:dTDP-4-amino-4,6-dideoxygalactose transaminase
VVIVHLYGQSADLDPIVDICKSHNIVLVEDAAESLGATYKGKHTGTFGTMAILSFNGNKIVTTSGGGMLVSNDGLLVEKARFLATQARDPFPHYEHSLIGYNYRLSNICAAIGRGQLCMLRDKVDKKRRIFEYYRDSLSNIPGISFMPEAPFGKSNRWLSCLVFDPQASGTTRDKVRLALERENIESRPLWKPMHLQPVFKDHSAFINGVSQDLFNDGLCLPSGTNLTENELEIIIGLIRSEVS